MPQNPLGSYVGINLSKKFVPLNVDAFGNLLITSDIGQSTTLNITTQTVIKASAGSIFAIIVNTAGSTAGTLNDAATTGAVAASNLIYTAPNTIGRTALEFPFKNGLVVTPGTGQVLAVSFT